MVGWKVDKWQAKLSQHRWVELFDNFHRDVYVRAEQKTSVSSHPLGYARAQEVPT